MGRNLTSGFVVLVLSVAASRAVGSAEPS